MRGLHTVYGYASLIGANSQNTIRLRNELVFLNNEIEKTNKRLVKVVRQRAFYQAKQAAKCAVLSAILMAASQKTNADSNIRFSLEPSNNGGVNEWKRAMKAIVRIPGGIPSFIRIKLWSILGDIYIKSAGFNWEQIRCNTLSEKVQPDDGKIHSQILKDISRTGWCEFDDEKKLKQVLLGYARYNKIIGYCQGFNVIAALILQVVEYRTDIALKVMIFLIEHVLPRGYFDQTLGALSVDMIVMRDLMLQRLPATTQHLEELQKSSNIGYEPPLSNIFSMHWFLTLFTTCLPRNCVMRVWDALMLNGSEILMRTAIVLWSKISREILNTPNVDAFYTLMKNLCKNLVDMDEDEQDHLINIVYNMAEFPYPGLAELREKHTWNIQPLSTTLEPFQKTFNNISYEEFSEIKMICTPCTFEIV
ncbi:TBC domain protein [Dictyocaulus viviparus]|uniref:TBC domain protein n=1 Tax=Dictyocaulus viviparus TaxID=29172 RepID=A0A0D8Y787_DICVI|nr:TBC domain protein [Dictyocaulus viviparus]